LKGNLLDHIRLMLDATAIGIVATEASGQIILSNPALEAMFGYAAGELIGQPLELLLPESKRDRHATQRAGYLRSPHTRPMGQGLNLWGRRKDGRSFPIEASLSMLELDEGPVAVAFIVDISARLVAEEARQASEALGRAVLDSLTAHVAVLDEHGTIVAVNTAWEQFARQNGGVPASTSIGVNYLDICRNTHGAESDDAERALAAISAVLKGVLASATFEYPCHAPDEQRWFVLRVTRLAGERRGVVVAHENVTALRRIEASLQEREQSFQTVFDNAPIGMALSDLSGSIVTTNPAFQKMLGFRADELRGMVFTSVIHPDDRQVARELYDDVVTGRRDHYNLERRYIRKDGQMIWGRPHAALVRAGNSSARFVIVTLEDITSRKQAEEACARLVALVDGSDDAILSKDLDGTVLSWNAGAERIYGYTAEEIIGQKSSILFSSEYTDEEQRILKRIRGGERLTHYETVRLRKGGQPIDVSLTISPIRDGFGNLIGTSVIARDIRERKRADQELRRKNLFLQLLQDVTVAASQASTLEAGLQVAVDQVCTLIGWPVGHAYVASAQRPYALAPTNIWHLADPNRFAIFQKITQAIDFASMDDLPGRVLLSGKPEWIVDLGHAPTSIRGKLISNIGVRAGFAFPVLVGSEVAAVLEFFAPEASEPDEALLEVMKHVGAQLGHLVERARADTALRASEVRYRTLVEQIPAIIYQADTSSKSATSYVSPQIEAILGFTPAEWMGDPELWIKQIHPDDRAMVLSTVERAQASDTPVPAEYRSFTRDGRVVWLQDASRMVRDDMGQPLFMQGVTIDITERKRAEEALRRSEQVYRNLANNFPKGAVFLFDRDLRYTVADGQALAEQGFKREAIEGKTLFEVLPPAAAAAQEPLYRATLEGQPAVYESITGGRSFVSYYLPIKNEQDEIDAGMIVSHDITQLKQVEQALVEERALLARRVEERTADLSSANADLARAARLKDEFLASMSHELRTPLNAILGLSEALQEEVYGSLNDQQAKTLRNIEESGRHLLDLINDILDLAKIGAGKLELQFDLVSVDAVCQGSLRMIRQSAQKKRITVETTIGAGVTHLCADGRRLKQILVNLLSNAVKFTPEGGRVGLEVSGDTARQTIHFTVWDTGIGIPLDELDRLFQPFVQLDSRLARQYEGTGLGLALVYRMAELHGGGISVASEAGVGSQFTVSLPWGCQDTPAELPAASKRWGIAAGSHKLVRKALIIDDSPTTAEQVARYLNEQGVEAVALARGADTIERVLEIEPDLILLDILLPDTNGWDVLARLKAEPATQSIPVIIVSVVDEQAQAMELGAAGYLMKPLTRQHIQLALRQLAAAPPNEALEEIAEPPQARPYGHGPRMILLAEDNEANIATLSDYLSAKGYQMIASRNGAEAIARARETRPALILMDIQMPGMDGLEATRRIRADAALANLPIIALTALAMPGDRERCLEAGANDYLSKPIGLRQLVATIEHYLQE
jgi:PAS domain S-box-containing protein